MIPKGVTDQYSRKKGKSFSGRVSPESRKNSTINWDTLCSPKVYAGLGHSKQSLHAQACVKLLVSTGTFWGSLMEEKYFHDSSVLEAQERDNNSWVGKHIYKSIDLFMEVWIGI